MGKKTSQENNVQDAHRRNRHDGSVLVTGSSGFVGRWLVKKLSEAEHRVVSVYRHKLPETMSNVYPVCLDLSMGEKLVPHLKDASTVVHLAWENNFVGPRITGELTSANCLNAVNVQNVKNLIQRMEDAGTRRLVFLSVNGASRYAANPFLREKYFAESLILNSRIPEKVIIRSSVVCGSVTQQDKFMKSIIGLMKFPGFYPVPRAADPLAPIFVEDLAEIIRNVVSATIHQEAAVLEITGGEKVRVEDMFKLVSDRVFGGSRMQIRGAIGNSLVPLFEGKGKNEADRPRVKDFLAIKNSVDQGVSRQNPLSDVVPDKLRGIREALSING